MNTTIQVPPTPPPPDDTAPRIFAGLTSMMQFDELEIRNVVRGIIAPTDREKCFIFIYWRTAAHAMSLSKLNSHQHFQAITMIARNLFELSVDLKLIDIVHGWRRKIDRVCGSRELSRCGKIVRFKQKHPTSRVDDSLYQSYIASEGTRIEATKARLWPV